MKPNSHVIEPLESRIAPASLTGRVLTYTDLDGDKVTITISTGTLAGSMFTFDTGSVNGDNTVRQQLQQINVSGAAGIDGADISMKVTKAGGGDGLAHVGFIDASLVDLNKVILKGDLGRIIAGDATVADDPGLNLLQVRTMGTLGLVSQGGAGDLHSIITGKLGALKVAGDFTDAFLEITASTAINAQLGSVLIGGDLTGGTADNSGRIHSDGAMGDVRINGGITGGVGSASGQIHSDRQIGNVRLGDGLTGGAGADSGTIISEGAMGDLGIARDITGGAGGGSGRVRSIGAMGDVRVGGDVMGSTGAGSGTLIAFDTMGNLSIGGDLAAGAGSGSALVGGNSAMGNVRIGGDVIGGSISGSASSTDSGHIRSFGRIASVTIGGSLIAGVDASSGTLIRCGAITAGDDLGPVKIGGSIIGNSTNPALIIARGQDVKPITGFDTAIASLSVGGDVRFARVLAGFDNAQAPANADASIGKVSIGRDWVASSLVAGAQDTGAVGFGVGDTLQTVGNTDLIARIASLTIKGDVSGSLAPGDNFGFVAQQIDKLKIGTRTFTLTPGESSPADNLLIAFTDDVHLLEV